MKLFLKIFFSQERKTVELEDEVTLVKDHCRLDIRKYSFSEDNKLMEHIIYRLCKYWQREHE